MGYPACTWPFTLNNGSISSLKICVELGNSNPTLFLGACVFYGLHVVDASPLILKWKNQGRSSHHELTDLTCQYTSCLGLPWTVIGQVKAHISYLPCCPGLAGTHGSGLVSVLRQ